MSLPEYIVLSRSVTMGVGLPVLGYGSLIAAGTLAGEGRLNVGVVLATAVAAWMLGSLIGYEIGAGQGRRRLEHSGRLEKMRLKLLTKGGQTFAHNNFEAAVTMPSFWLGFFGCVSAYSCWERLLPVPDGSQFTSGFRISSRAQADAISRG
jgi:hypothetical protein